MTADAIIVGTGVIGKSIAYTLARAGMRVTCVGPGSFAPGTASTAAGAMLGVLGEVTAGARAPLDQEELRLRAAAGRLYPDFLAELGETGEQAVQLGYGTFIVGNTVNEADAGNLTAIREAARALDLRCEPADPSGVPGLRPARGHEPIGVLYLADEGFLDSWQLLEALDRALGVLPAVTVEAAVAASVAVRDGRAVGVRLDDGRLLPAGNVVLASGVGVQPLLDELGELPGRLPRLLPGKGVSMLVTDIDDPVPHVIRTPNRDFACGSHMVPRSDGTVYLGATNRVSATPGHHAAVTPGEVHALLHSMMHEVNVRIRTASLISTRYGLRPLTSDGYPLIGSTELDGLWLATGTYRNGVLLAPAIARIIAEEVSGAAPTVGNSFGPTAEFRGTAKNDASEVLTAGLQHLASFILEPGGHLPYDRSRELRAFLTKLAFLAFSDDAENEIKRAEIQRVLGRYPIPEVVPQLYYWLARDDAEGLPVQW